MWGRVQKSIKASGRLASLDGYQARIRGRFSFDALAEAGEVGAHGFGVVAGDDVL